MKTPAEIKKGLECCYGDKERRLCEKCPNGVMVEGYSEIMCTNFDSLGENALALIQQLERERDAAVEALLLLADTDCLIPCESDELACSEYCENHCSFRTPQKECWMEYFRRRGVQEVE